MKPIKSDIVEETCPACNGTGFLPVVTRPAPGRRIYPPRCTKCDGRSLRPLGSARFSGRCIWAPIFFSGLDPGRHLRSGVALLSTTVAILIQEALRTIIGIELHFAVFFSTIVLVSLMAGAPAGAFAAALAVPFIWWEFLPPQLEFDYDRFVFFLLPLFIGYLRLPALPRSTRGARKALTKAEPPGSWHDLVASSVTGR